MKHLKKQLKPLVRHIQLASEHALRRAIEMADPTLKELPSPQEKSAWPWTDESQQLPDTLANFDFQSGNNGMSWGVWDPKYQSVGIVKVKPE